MKGIHRQRRIKKIEKLRRASRAYCPRSGQPVNHSTDLHTGAQAETKPSENRSLTTEYPSVEQSDTLWRAESSGRVPGADHGEKTDAPKSQDVLMVAGANSHRKNDDAVCSKVSPQIWIKIYGVEIMQSESRLQRLEISILSRES